jgi:hypothetical protein
MPLAQSLLNAVSDLLFCPEFTVAPNKKGNRDEVDELHVSDSNDVCPNDCWYLSMTWCKFLLAAILRSERTTSSPVAMIVNLSFTNGA